MEKEACRLRFLLVACEASSRPSEGQKLLQPMAVTEAARWVGGKEEPCGGGASTRAKLRRPLGEARPVDQRSGALLTNSRLLAMQHKRILGKGSRCQVF